jgi:hypothetical protein
MARLIDVNRIVLTITVLRAVIDGQITINAGKNVETAAMTRMRDSRRTVQVSLLVRKLVRSVLLIKKALCLGDDLSTHH